MSKHSKEDLEAVVLVSKNFSDVVRKLTNKEKVHGGMISFIKGLILDYEIDITHFTGRAWNKGLVGSAPNKITLERLISEYLTLNPIKKTNNTNLKRWIFGFELLENKCTKCGCNDEWFGQKLVLQLDHIDGNTLNNELTNLRILCPNCHSQTDTYAGSNNKK